MGLDLQGGMYVLLEADIPILVEKLADKSTEALKNAIRDVSKTVEENETSETSEDSETKCLENKSIKCPTYKNSIDKDNYSVYL